LTRTKNQQTGEKFAELDPILVKKYQLTYEV